MWTGWPPRDEETAEALKKVYMSGEWSFNSPSEQAFEQAFADAWEKLLSANYRCSNLNHTGYMGGLLGQYGDYASVFYIFIIYFPILSRSGSMPDKSTARF